jgi:hypothetical protein
MKTLYVLYVGLIDRDGKRVLSSARGRALQDTANTFGGYTLSCTDGGYTSASGELITEPSMRIEVLTEASLLTVRAWAERLRAFCNQESVLLIAHSLTYADFIGIDTAALPIAA